MVYTDHPFSRLMNSSTARLMSQPRTSLWLKRETFDRLKKIATRDERSLQIGIRLGDFECNGDFSPIIRRSVEAIRAGKAHEVSIPQGIR
jgi:hypothetical protein